MLTKKKLRLLTLMVVFGVVRIECWAQPPGSSDSLCLPAILLEEHSVTGLVEEREVVVLDNRSCDLNPGISSDLTFPDLEPQLDGASTVLLDDLSVAPDNSGEDLLERDPATATSIFYEPVHLDVRLSHCPKLGDHIIWERPDGCRVSYSHWTDWQRERLNHFFQAYLSEPIDLGFRCPDPKKSLSTDGKMYLSQGEAFDLYASQIAHAIYLEAEQKVPWRMVSRPAKELKELLASDRYFSRILPSQRTDYPAHIKPGRDYQLPFRSQRQGLATCDPRTPYRFLSGAFPTQKEPLLGQDEVETLANLTAWARDHIAHKSWKYRQLVIGNHYEFLADALVPKKDPENDGFSYIPAYAGCHVASNLLYELAKGVNIPLLNVGSQEDNGVDDHYENRSHRGLVYGWGGSAPKILWHVDDIYAFADEEPSFSIDQNGKRLSQQQADSSYFNRYWVSPTELIKWGFVYDLHTVFPTRGFGIDNSPVPEPQDYQHYGYMVGHWLVSDRWRQKADEIVALIKRKQLQNLPIEDDDYYNPFVGDVYGRLRLENQYQLCSYGLMDFRCNKGAHYENGKANLKTLLDNRQGGSITGHSLPSPRMADDVWALTLRCANAYGGCYPSVMDQKRKWLDSKNSQ